LQRFLRFLREFFRLHGSNLTQSHQDAKLGKDFARLENESPWERAAAA
jgi:hypothetical protein